MYGSDARRTDGEWNTRRNDGMKAISKRAREVKITNPQTRT